MPGRRAVVAQLWAVWIILWHPYMVTVQAFVPASTASSSVVVGGPEPRIGTSWTSEDATSTSLSALRTWNLNRQPGASPFGLDLNAEVWNGRVAQVAFTWVFIQEWIQGKGVLKGLSDGDVINLISASVFAVLIAAVTVRFLLEPAAGATSRHNVHPQFDGRSSPYHHVPTVAKTVRTVTNPYGARDNMLENFNDGRSPFGLKTNAEIWNGRIAMFSFVWVIVQEFVMGEGFITAIEKSDTAALIALGAELVTILGFTVGMSTVAFQDDYVERVVGKESLIMNAKYANQWTPSNVERPYELPPISSVTPGLGVSDPVTYEMYMRERALLEAREKATQDAQWASSFSNSLKAMSASDVDSSSPSFQVHAAQNPSPAWGSAKTAVASTATEAATSASTLSLPFGAAYAPVVVQPGLYTAINYPLPSDADSTIVSPVMASSAMAMGVPVTTVPGSAAVDETVGVAVRPAFVGQPMGTEDRSGRPKPPVTFRVDGYRFKPETQSAIGTSPHPGGVFTFKSDTSFMIKSSNVPKPKPVAYPVEGFKFGENTKTFIKATERTAVVAPEMATTWQAPPQWQAPAPQAQVPPPEPIVSPSFSSVDVVPPSSGGVPQALNTAPAGNAVSRPYRSLGSGSSYLEALNGNAGTSASPVVSVPPPEDSELVVVMSGRSAPSKLGSYLDSL